MLTSIFSKMKKVKFLIGLLNDLEKLIKVFDKYMVEVKPIKDKYVAAYKANQENKKPLDVQHEEIFNPDEDVNNEVA